MASILRQIVAGPRARHPEANLDLCYVTDNIVVTSGPSSVWPKKAYRNPTDQLVAFLDRKHGDDWAIFEFRAEGTGYPDSEVYNRVHHFPWPDHHPPPFAIVPNLMAAMRNWIQRLDGSADAPVENQKRRVAVVHCKAGKGRSGTSACSYLISEEGWKKDDALERFTSRRMRAGFGAGVSIPSQLRWVGYVDRWTNSMGKKYIERPIEITEIHVYGLRDGVKVTIEGYVENGRRIQNFHNFTRQEKTVIDEGQIPTKQAPLPMHDLRKDTEILTSSADGAPKSSTHSTQSTFSGSIQTVILRPSSPVVLPTSDVNIDFERRNKASYTGFTMVTSIAHVWFNAYFEGGHEGHESGVFEIDWEAMDGIKGSIRKGTKALDKLKVVWKYHQQGDTRLEKLISEPVKGEPVQEGEAANWKGDSVDKDKEAEAKHSDGVSSGRAGGAALTMGAMINQGAESLAKELGLRPSDPGSANLSRASSEHEHSPPRKGADIQNAEEAEDFHEEGVKAHGPSGEDLVQYDGHEEGIEGRNDTKVGHGMETGMSKMAEMVSKLKGTNNHHHHHENMSATAASGKQNS